MNQEPTFVFENGKVYAMVEGRVVASAKSVEDLENARYAVGPGAPGEDSGMDPRDMSDHHEVEMPDPPPDVQHDLGLQSCPQCHSPTQAGDQYCAQCGSPVHGDPAAEGPAPDEDLYGTHPPDQAYAIARTIETPNGLKGQVLGSGMWDDEITVRLENGRIVRLAVTDDLKTAGVEKTQEVDKLASLELRLAASVDGTEDSLKARSTALEGIERDAVALIPEGDTTSTLRLDEIAVQARHERSEIGAALEHLAAEEVESFTPPAPFRIQAIEQESVGGADSSWLDHTVNGMIAEAETTNYEKLMDEGPEAFVAELEDAPLANSGVTRQMASRFIQSHTAGADPELREKYEKVWLARVEEVRKAQSATRKQTTEKEAASEEDYSNLPDDVLFT